MFYNIHWKLGEHKGKATMEGVTKEAVIKGFTIYAGMDMGNPYSIPFEAEITKIITLHPSRKSTPKQKLAQKYGMIQGGIKGARIQFEYALLPTLKDYSKENRAYHLVQSQFAKLQRDISDCFKLLGLKIK